MELLYELEFRLPYTIKSKKRHRTRKNTQAQYNPSKKDEEELLFDLTNLLDELDVRFIKTIKDDERAIIEVSVVNYYKTTNIKLINKPRIKTPDVDNFLKLAMDAVNGEFWNDDRQVYKTTSEKYYSDRNISEINIRYYK